MLSYLQARFESVLYSAHSSNDNIPNEAIEKGPNPFNKEMHKEPDSVLSLPHCLIW